MKNIHLIPTDKPSRLHYSKIKSNDKISYKLVLKKEFSKRNDGLLSGQRYIYITSDEEIKDGDWVYSEARNTLLKVKSKTKTSVGTLLIEDDIITPLEINEVDCKKIILTTDQDLIKDGVQAIDDEFINWFVENPSCEMVEVEDWLDNKGCVAWGLSGRYQIIIPKEEPKQETLEEALQKYDKSKCKHFRREHTSDILYDSFNEGFVEGAKWQQERMYSEKEVKKALHDCMILANETDNIGRLSKFIEKWFKQFKKK